METNISADDFMEQQAKMMQHKINTGGKKKQTLVKKPQHHFDSADYEKAKQIQEELNAFKDAEADKKKVDGVN